MSEPPSQRGGRSLRPRPRQSLKAQELAQLSSSPFSEHKALLRIVPTRRSQSRSRLRDSPGASGTSSQHAFSPLPSPTTTADTAESATPPSSQPSQKQAVGCKDKKRSRASAASSTTTNAAAAGIKSSPGTKKAAASEDNTHGPPKANKPIILPTRAPLNTPPTDPLVGPKIPTFDYYQSNLPTQEDSAEESAEDEASDGVPPSSNSQIITGANPTDTRRQAKEYLEKEGFYNWSVKKVIHAHDQHRHQNHGYHSHSPSQQATPSPLLSGRSQPTTSGGTTPKVGGKQQHPKDSLRLTTSGRITRSMSGPSRTRSPRRRLVDSKTAAHDLKMDHQTSVERHRWAMRDIASAAAMLETNARNMDEENGTRGIIASDKRKAGYRNLTQKHLVMLKQIAEEWEAWSAESPKELGAFSMKNGGQGPDQEKVRT